MIDIRLDKKATILAIVTAVIVVLGLVFVYPLFGEIKMIRYELEIVSKKLGNARYMIGLSEKDPVKGRLLAREEISLAIDEITKRGNAFNVNFLSMTPRVIEEMSEGYQRLPIHMELESAYKDLGIFMRALENLNEAVVVIHKFKILREQRNPSLVKTDMTINLLLESGHE